MGAVSAVGSLGLMLASPLAQGLITSHSWQVALIAFLGGTTATIDMSQILYRRLSISGSTLRPRSIEFKGEIAATLRSKVWPLLAAGKLKPVFHSVFGFADAARAHALMESSVHVGKIMLQPASSAG